MSGDEGDEPPFDMSRAVSMVDAQMRGRSRDSRTKRSRPDAPIVPTRSAPHARRDANSRISALLGIAPQPGRDDDRESDEDGDSEEGCRPRAKKRRIGPVSAPQVAPASRAPIESDYNAIHGGSEMRGNGDGGEEASEECSAMPWQQWRADDPYIPRCGRDPRYVQSESDMQDAITERRDDYCFLCTMSGEYSAMHASALSDMWRSGILTHTLFTTAKHVSSYYNENIRVFTESKRQWTVRSVYEHFTLHVIDETTLTTVVLRDQLQLALHQMYLLNSMRSDNRLAPIDPAAVGVYMRLCHSVLKLQKDLKSIGGS